jgi:hypothetical protein
VKVVTSSYDRRIRNIHFQGLVPDDTNPDLAFMPPAGLDPVLLA